MNLLEKKTRQSVDAPRENMNLLVIILDTNPYIWAKRRLDQTSSMQGKTLLNFEQCLNQLLLFINSYLSTNAKNKLAVIAAHTKPQR
jgi:hypothetical protein